MSDIKFLVTFDRESCKGCGLCRSVCPENIILMDQEVVNGRGYHPAYIQDMEQCIGCQRCALICPDVVIRIEKIDVKEES